MTACPGLRWWLPQGQGEAVVEAVGQATSRGQRLGFAGPDGGGETGASDWGLQGQQQGPKGGNRNRTVAALSETH